MYENTFNTFHLVFPGGPLLGIHLICRDMRALLMREIVSQTKSLYNIAMFIMASPMDLCFNYISGCI